jgi:hypothetical protein
MDDVLGELCYVITQCLGKQALPAFQYVFEVVLVVNLWRNDSLLPAVVDCSDSHAVNHARVVFGSFPDLPVIVNVFI